MYAHHLFEKKNRTKKFQYVGINSKHNYKISIHWYKLQNALIWCRYENSSTNTVSSTLKYRPRTCLCGKKADIRVTQSEMNKGKLYYACKQGTCNFWDWCTPVNPGEQAVMNRAPIQVLNEDKAVKEMHLRVKTLEENQGYMKLLLVITIVMSFFALFVAVMKWCYVWMVVM